MYLVVGATGPVGLGGEICRLLRAAGRPMRALVRPTSDAPRVEGLRQAGVDLVQGDLKDRRSLQAACRDVRTIISTASMMVSRQPDDTVERVDGRGHADLIDVAKACGVESFVYISFSGRIDRSFPFRNAKRDVEGHLTASGLTYTILRPTFYMEVWLTPIGGFDYLNGRATIYGEGRNKISWLSFYDVARVALMCLDSDAARNATFELGGPDALSPLEVVHIFEQLSGRRSNSTTYQPAPSLSNRTRPTIPGRVQSLVFDAATLTVTLSMCESSRVFSRWCSPQCETTQPVYWPSAQRRSGVLLRVRHGESDGS